MSPARARTSRAAILAASRDLLEEGGLDAVSMAAIALRVGVRAPSLYKHFADRDELLGAVATDVAMDLGRMMARAAAASGAEPSVRLPALATAYRAFARAKPRAAALLFAGVTESAVPAQEAQVEAARPVLEVATAIVGPEHALAAARVVVAFAHGFTSMESSGAFRFGGDVDEAYQLGIETLLLGLGPRPARGRPSGTPGSATPGTGWAPRAAGLHPKAGPGPGRWRMSKPELTTPAAAGFSMPPEWAPHAACLMAWPTRRELWRDRFDQACRDYAAVARAIADFEPVWMMCNPGTAAEVRDHCGTVIETIELPINDSWARDSGPVFVRDGAGRVAAVKFGFNAWGNRWHPHDDDAKMPDRIAQHLGMRLFRAPFVLEGGAFLVDGEGTLVTTEQCLLNPNRNPGMNREQLEQGLRDFLGVTTVVWLPFGHSLDVGPEGTDGHVDGVAQYLAPGRILLEAPADPGASEHEPGQANLARLHAARDARGRSFEVRKLDPGPRASVSYANHYLANGAVIVPTGGDAADGPVLELLASVYPEREIVGVPGTTLLLGGGGPHCITQQVPVGAVATP